MIEVPFYIIYIIFLAGSGITGLIGWLKHKESAWDYVRILGSIIFLVISATSIIILIANNVRFV